MKRTVIFLFCGVFICCKSIKTTPYFSTCTLYGKPDVSLQLNLDKSFVYDFRYNDKKITGKWKVNSDTLILTSEFFNESTDSLSPKIKNSDRNGVDKYLIKGNKLFIINKLGLEKDCYLKAK